MLIPLENRVMGRKGRAAGTVRKNGEGTGKETKQGHREKRINKIMLLLLACNKSIYLFRFSMQPLSILVAPLRVMLLEMVSISSSQQQNASDILGNVFFFSNTALSFV